MKIVVVYVYAPAGGKQYEQYALRFLDCYHRFSAGVAHDTVVALNGAAATTELKCLFGSLPNLTLLEHDNSGYDIGAFQHAARDIPCDMMVFFGASTWFTRPGWLLRMATSFERHGPAQYGAMGNRGDIPVRVWPHIRTTAFWMPPDLMNKYPTRVTQPGQRHPFEHGPNCFSEWLRKRGVQSWVVTWGKELLWRDWDSDINGYNRGNQSSLLAGDHLCEPPYYPRSR